MGNVSGCLNFFFGDAFENPSGIFAACARRAARRRHPWRVRHWDIRVPISPIHGLRRLRNTPQKKFPSPFKLLLLTYTK